MRIRYSILSLLRSLKKGDSKMKQTEFKTINYTAQNEVMHYYEHISGLKAYLIEKKGYSKMHAAFATAYGSTVNEFKIPGQDGNIRVPDGIAHFLEHKLFEQKDGNVMDKFSALGANPNAYTGFCQTVYHFTCTDRFSENLELLLGYVQNPYLTDESVEKEKPIIGQEIAMYRDDPGYRVFFNLLGAFYRDNPVKADIAGTVESISKINKELLMKCYDTFYHPSNMIIFAAGEIDADSYFGMVDRMIKHKEKREAVKKVLPELEDKVHKDLVEEKMHVSIPLFHMGFYDNKHIEPGIEMLKREVGIRILMEMLAGRSSVLFDRLYGSGLLNNSFEFDYTVEETYAFSAFGGETPDPSLLKKEMLNGINEFVEKGFDRNLFERIRKARLGRFARSFNSIERISHMFIATCFRNANLFDYFDIYDKITYEYVAELAKEHFNPEHFAISVVTA